MTNKKTIKGLVAFAILFIAFFAIALGCYKSSRPSPSAPPYAHTVADDVPMTHIVKDGETSYTVLFSSSDKLSYGLDFSKEIQQLARSKYNTWLLYNVDTMQSPESSCEILIGKTNRALSSTLYNLVMGNSNDDNLVWGIMEKNGKVAYLANSKEAFNRGKADFLAFMTEDSFSIPKGFKQIYVLSRADYDAELKAEQDRLEKEKEQLRLQKIEELKALIGDFNYSDFGDAPSTSMTGTGYSSPKLYPTTGEHPRVNVTSYMLPDIIKYMNSNEAKYTTAKFWEMANTECTGILPPATTHTTGRIGVHNMDEGVLAIIEAKAFAYLITGNELYAYEAIYAMKNFLITIDIQHIYSDQCREFGRIMYCTAEVYDWCYDLLTKEDKEQFIMACADIGSSQNQNTDFGNQMEVGFPPRLQGCVSGHGSEHQVLRDYLSISIAIFDEDPTWYEWVGGMVYNYYVPFRDYYFQSGTYPQGINTYAGHRFDADLWSAWLLRCAVGENPYSADFASVTRSFFLNELPDGTYFGTGDGSRKGNGKAFWTHAVISSALYGDADLRAQASYFSGGFANYSANSMSFSYTQMLILSTSYHNMADSTNTVDRFSGSDPVCYLGSPLGQMTVRSQWNDPSSAAVFMKIGERTTANHEHADVGTFQIFYKGLYTGDSGIYSDYGSTHWRYYHTQTVAHNGLLIVDPDRIGNNPANEESYFYSGGQRRLAEVNNLDEWLSSTYDTGSVIGSGWAYKDDGTVDFAYLGGDITLAYEPTVVSYAGRHMLALYTGNPEAPMYFVVYDKLTSIKESFKKTFLLQTASKPEIDLKNRTVTSVTGTGKLVLKSLLGGDSITAIGGEGMTFAINERQCATDDNNDGSNWGRVEISPTSEALTHHLVNFMYVTDTASNAVVEPTLVTAENYNAVLIDRDVLVFADAEGDKNTSELRINVEGRGLKRFIVMGMFEGTWNISVDGVPVAHSVSDEGGGMITFYAPPGNIVISPGKDIAPSNGGRIVYNTFGGIIPEGSPLVYEIGVPVTLPTTVSNGLNKFEGWFTSPYFEEETRVTELVGTEKGKIHVYAKFKGTAFVEDYEKTVLDHNRITANKLSYMGKTGTEFKTLTDEKTGNTYLHIKAGTEDQQIDTGATPASYVYGDKIITLVLDLARDGSTPIASTCRIRGQKGSKDIVPYFSTTADGSVLLGGSLPVMTLTREFHTLAVTLDFENGTISGYDGEGNLLGTLSFVAPEASGITSTAEWFSSVSSSINWWMRVNEGSTLLIDNISLYEGAYVPKPVVLPEGYSNINYNLNGGSFITQPDKFYKEGTVTLLEPNVIKGLDDFLGWYTTPDFKPGTGIAEISKDTTGEVTVYAKWANRILFAPFDGADFNISENNDSWNDIQFAGTDKAGSIFKSETDATGNTYLYWNKGSSDPQLKYAGSFGTFPGKKAATFEISLATVAGETPMAIQYRVRASTKAVSQDGSNYFMLFTTDTNGNVKLGGTTVIANLSSDFFTKIIITADFEDKELIAYSESGTEIERIKLSINDYDDWSDGIDLPIYIYPSGGQSLKLDDIAISAAPYSPKEVILPTTQAKIDYITAGGTLPSGTPKYYTKGEAFTLPIPTKDNSTFLGWYKDTSYTERITEITSDDTESFILYALWKTVIADFNADENDVNHVGDGTNNVTLTSAAGFTFQMKGQNSYYQTCEDPNGGKYLLWSKGTGDPQIMKTGTLSSSAGTIKLISFSLTFAKNGDNPFVAFRARMRTPTLSVDNKRRELPLFKLTTDGSLYLSDIISAEMKIGQFGTDFKTLGVVADFNTGTLYGYNENGEKVCECAMTIPAPYTTPAEMYHAVTAEILGFYAGTTAETSMLIKRIKVETGNVFES